MRSAVIGLGNMGSIHAELITEQGNELAAVCDVDSAKFEGFPETAHFSDYREMLDEVKPDVVHICTPHYLHAEMILEALARDISVLCEKPLCIHEEDIPKIIEAEKKSKGFLSVCHQNRYNPANLCAKDLLKDIKVYSGIAYVAWARDTAYYQSGAWRGKWETEGGGVLINQALHTLDLLQWFCGMPDEVVGTVSNHTHRDCIEVEDTASLLYRGEHNFSFFATTSSQSEFPVEIVLNTEIGIIHVFEDYVVVNGEMRTFDKNDHIYGKACYGSGHGRLIADFYDHVRRGETFQTSGEEAAKVVKLILAAYRSQGELVKI